MTKVLDQQIPPVDSDPVIQRHTRQLRELKEKLSAVQARGAALRAEQTDLRTAAHEASVAAVLGGKADASDHSSRTARLAELAIDVERLSGEEGTLRDALERLTAIAAQSRAQAQQEHDAQVQAAARAVLGKMAPLVEQLLALNQQLIPLAERVPAGTLLVPPPALLLMWHEQARGVVGGAR